MLKTIAVTAAVFDVIWIKLLLFIGAVILMWRYL